MKSTLALFLSTLILTGCSTVIHSYSSTGLPAKNIIFTFDDGPNGRASVTADILAVLKKYGIRAFFDVIGKQVEAHPDLAKRIVDEGHIIANHSYDHKFPLFMSRRDLETEIDRCDQAIAKALGIENFRCAYVQPPYAIMNSSFKKLAQDRGLKIVGLTSMPFPPDSEYSPNQYHKIVKAYEKDIEKNSGGVIVLHDGCFRGKEFPESDYANPDKIVDRSAVPKALEELIVYFTQRGYTFNADR